MSTIRRDKSPKGAGKSPIFSVRLTPEFKEQLDGAAARAGVSLGNWLKELAREELRRQGEEPKANGLHPSYFLFSKPQKKQNESIFTIHEY
jgi:hypothetical protein